MNFLFVHNNFPAQFVHAVRMLARDPNTKIAGIGTHTSRAMNGVKLLKYAMPEGDVRPDASLCASF